MSKVKSILLGTSTVAIAALLAGCGSSKTDEAKQGTYYQTISVRPDPIVQNITHYHTDEQQRKQQLLINFLDNQMMGNGGIYTNYLPTNDPNSQNATGRELLDESSGYYLLHLALTKQSQAFKTFYEKTKKNFYENGQFSYRYDPATGKRYPVNATVDDLRIIEALFLYDQQFQTNYYAKEINTLYKNMQSLSLVNGNLYDWANGETKQHATTGTLCYFNLATLHALENQSKTGKQYYQKQLHIVQKGYISDDFPLYQTRYNYKTGKYTSDKGIDILESLMTMQHLSAVGKLPKTSLQWVTRQVMNKQLYNHYDMNGKATTQDQSAAAYALAALIASNEKQPELYQAAIKQMLTFQINKAGSPLNGAFGDLQTQQVYSFNNVTALVALDC